MYRFIIYKNNRVVGQPDINKLDKALLIKWTYGYNEVRFGKIRWFNSGFCPEIKYNRFNWE